MTRVPSSALVVDANILIGAALGVRSRGLIAEVAARRHLVLPDRAAVEARQIVRKHGEGKSRDALEILVSNVTLVPDTDYEDFLGEASRVLQDAPPSRNGSTKDAFLLAAAWRFDADVWSHDRDFAGAGWASWSSRNLMTALSREEP